MKIEDRIDKLNKRKEFLESKKEKTETELKEVKNKIKKYEEIEKERDIKETLIIAEKTGFKITDIKRILKSGNKEDLEKLLKG